jgi:mannose-6-phosphate isomerase-like protein (cupin superfamily)
MKETDNTTLPIVQMAKDNDKFRKVVMTGEKTQVVLMAIPEGSEIGAETHEGHDQVLIFVEGTGKAIIGKTETSVGEGYLSFVPSGAYHNFINDGSGPLKLYTTYSPPEHEPGVEHETKAEADADES